MILLEIDNKHIVVKCDFQKSPKCRDIYQKSKSSISRDRLKTDNKDICMFCSRVLKPHKKYKFDESIFSSIDNEFKAYFLGLIAAEGYISKLNYISIELHESDRAILENIKNRLCPDMHITKRYNRPMVYFVMCSKRMVLDVCKCLGLEGTGKKSRTIKIPDLKESIFYHFLRGYFDGDGCIRPISKKLLQVQISSFSDHVLNGLREATSKIGTRNYLGRHSITWCGNSAISILDKMYNNSTIYIQRKHKEYLKWKDHLSKKHYNILTKDWIYNNYVIGKKKVEQIAKEAGCTPETLRTYVKKYGFTMRIKKKWNKELIVEKVKEIMQKNGKIPSYNCLKNKFRLTYAIQKYFGGLKKLKNEMEI